MKLLDFKFPYPLKSCNPVWLKKNNGQTWLLTVLTKQKNFGSSGESVGCLRAYWQFRVGFLRDGRAKRMKGREKKSCSILGSSGVCVPASLLLVGVSSQMRISWKNPILFALLSLGKPDFQSTEPFSIDPRILQKSQ